MQKPTIEIKSFKDSISQYTIVTDCSGIQHSFLYVPHGQKLHLDELAQWEAEQAPQVLFKSETFKVVKFNNHRHFQEWYRDENNHKSISIDFSVPTLIEYRKGDGWWATHNITRELAQAIQIAHKAQVFEAEKGKYYCTCSKNVTWHQRFCSQCGARLTFKGLSNKDISPYDHTEMKFKGL